MLHKKGSHLNLPDAEVVCTIELLDLEFCGHHCETQIKSPWLYYHLLGPTERITKQEEKKKRKNRKDRQQEKNKAHKIFMWFGLWTYIY